MSNPTLKNRFSYWLKKAISKQKTEEAPRPDVEYNFDRFTILLPADHMLPSYQQHHKKYNKFLPHLVRHLSESITIVDVGANCGDTLAAIVQYKLGVTYYPVEGDPIFFEYLLQNIERIKSNKLIGNFHVYPINSIVTGRDNNVSLEGVGGTKHAVVKMDGVPNNLIESLDNILSSFSLESLDLLKIDVDGFDWDVINSARKTVLKYNPLIFFELFFSDHEQRQGYVDTVNWLTANGYNDYSIFDNFGELILRTDSIRCIHSLMEYVNKQNQGITTRTIYYFDILAGTCEHKALIDQTLASY